MRGPIAILILVCFLGTSIIGPIPVQAQEFSLPKPGVMVHLSPEFNPPVLKGIKVHTDNPFRFDFILDKGDSLLPDNKLKEESKKLIKYFLASLTIPEKDLWVNLSPYEKDRIIPQSFGLTEMGRDLLAEDYMLKQITASVIYPEDEVGKKFWKRIYEEAAKKFGTTNIPVNTFNKVWIVPEKAVVYENTKAGTAYVVESKLKVMLEEDYLALSHNDNKESNASDTNKLGSQIVREIVIPALTKEVNEGKNFTQLRQVYQSLIIATWYKRKIKDSILSQIYSDKNKVMGVNVNDPKEKDKIYQRYLQAFKKGVYNYIKEENDPSTQQPIPRKYFSGGVILGLTTVAAGNVMQYQNNLPNSAMVANDRAMIIESKVADSAMQSNEDILQIQPTLAELESKLFAVHATRFLPKNGIVKASATDITSSYQGEEPPSFRATIHFALGEVVRSPSVTEDEWDKLPYAVVAPIKSLASQLVNIFPTDTYILGDLHLSKETVLVVPKGADISTLPPGVTTFEYDPKLGLRTAVEQVIKNQGGWPIRVPDNFELSAIATLNGQEITSKFFSALFAKYPELSYGTASRSEIGDAFRLGFLDLTLNQLMKYYSPDISIGNGQKEIPFYRATILHNLSKLEASLNRRALSQEAKVAFADKKEKLLAWMNIVDADLELKKEYGKTLVGMSKKIWRSVLQKRNNSQELRRYIDSIINELPYEDRRSYGPPSINLITAHLRMMSPSEIKEFRDESPEVLSGINTERLTSEYAMQRWIIVGTDEAKREGLDRIISENGSLNVEGIFSILETELSNSSNRLPDALEILRHPRIKTFLQGHGIVFTKDGPQTLEDVLKAHPQTKVIFESSGLNLSPEEQEARIFLERIRQHESGKPLQEAVQSFKTARMKALIDGYSEKRLKRNLIAVTKPLITRRSIDDYVIGDELELYTLLYQEYENPINLWKKIGLDKEFKKIFPDANLFWKSNKSLSEIYQQLRKMKADQEPNSAMLTISVSDVIQKEIPNQMGYGVNAYLLNNYSQKFFEKADVQLAIAKYFSLETLANWDMHIDLQGSILSGHNRNVVKTKIILSRAGEVREKTLALKLSSPFVFNKMEPVDIARELELSTHFGQNQFFNQHYSKTLAVASYEIDDQFRQEIRDRYERWVGMVNNIPNLNFSFQLDTWVEGIQAEQLIKKVLKLSVDPNKKRLLIKNLLKNIFVTTLQGWKATESSGPGIVFDISTDDVIISGESEDIDQMIEKGKVVFIDADGGKNVGGFDQLAKELNSFLISMEESYEYLDGKTVSLTKNEILQCISIGLGDMAEPFIQALRGNPEMTGSLLRTKIGDKAQITEEKGGIDLTSDKVLQVQNNGESIKFKMDSAMLQQLQNVPGFMPVIINIKPMGDLQIFLGIGKQEKQLI